MLALRVVSEVLFSHIFVHTCLIRSRDMGKNVILIKHYSGAFYLILFYNSRNPTSRNEDSQLTANFWIKAYTSTGRRFGMV